MEAPPPEFAAAAPVTPQSDSRLSKVRVESAP